MTQPSYPEHAQRPAQGQTPEHAQTPEHGQVQAAPEHSAPERVASEHSAHVQLDHVQPDHVQKPMQPDELERYARHIFLREVGGPGQGRLRAARVLVVGAGGLGAPVLLYLAAAGLGHITLVDDDSVSLSNLQRQVIYKVSDIGRPKVEAAAEALHALNPHVQITALATRLSEANALSLVAAQDLVIDGSDNFTTRHLANRACVAAGVPLLSGAITQWEGQLSLYDPAHGAPCLACVFPNIPAPGLAPSCAEAGVMGALPGIVGATMASEAIKEITHAGAGLRGRLMLFDALWGENREISVAQNPDCPVCGHSHTGVAHPVTTRATPA